MKYEDRVELKGSETGYSFSLQCDVRERNIFHDEGIRVVTGSKDPYSLTFKTREMDAAGSCSSRNQPDVLHCVTPGYDKLSLFLVVS